MGKNKEYVIEFEDIDTEAHSYGPYPKLPNSKKEKKPLGKKFDKDKIDLTLVPPSFEIEVARVLEFGAKKYGRDNWRHLFEEEPHDGHQRCLAAIMRHLNSIRKGELIDPESGLSHFAHIATGCAFIIEYSEREK